MAAVAISRMERSASDLRQEASGQHHPAHPAALLAAAQPGRKHLAVPQAELPRQPGVRQLRRHTRGLLFRVERPDLLARAARFNHPPRLGGHRLRPLVLEKPLPPAPHFGARQRGADRPGNYCSANRGRKRSRSFVLRSETATRPKPAAIQLIVAPGTAPSNFLASSFMDHTTRRPLLLRPKRYSYAPRPPLCQGP
jgi:hypothetical protein